MKPELFILLLTGGILATLNSFASPSDTLFYSYVNSGKIVGRQWVWQEGKGDYYYYDEYILRRRSGYCPPVLFTGALAGGITK